MVSIAGLSVSTMDHLITKSPALKLSPADHRQCQEGRPKMLHDILT